MKLRYYEISYVPAKTPKQLKHANREVDVDEYKTKDLAVKAAKKLVKSGCYNVTVDCFNREYSPFTGYSLDDEFGEGDFNMGDYWIIKSKLDDWE